MIRNDLDSNIIKIKSIDDRVAYIYIKLEENRSLIVIHVYIYSTYGGYGPLKHFSVFHKRFSSNYPFNGIN